jgi:cephalosporin hydroxylase
MKDLAASLEASHRQTAEGCVKTVEDLERYRIVLARTRPTLIIECGTFSGKSALWFAREGQCRVVTVDVDPNNVSAETHRLAALAGVCFLHGRSTGLMVGAMIHSFAAEEARVMVVLDSDHSADTVRQELAAYADLVTPGCYCVVEDTIVRWMPWEQHPIGPYLGSPLDAAEEWLAAHGDRWENDLELEDRTRATQHPGGWLRRKG